MLLPVAPTVVDGTISLLAAYQGGVDAHTNYGLACGLHASPCVPAGSSCIIHPQLVNLPTPDTHHRAHLTR